MKSFLGLAVLTLVLIFSKGTSAVIFESDGSEVEFPEINSENYEEFRERHRAKVRNAFRLDLGDACDFVFQEQMTSAFRRADDLINLTSASLIGLLEAPFFRNALREELGSDFFQVDYDELRRQYDNIDEEEAKSVFAEFEALSEHIFKQGNSICNPFKQLVCGPGGTCECGFDRWIGLIDNFHPKMQYHVEDGECRWTKGSACLPDDIIDEEMKMQAVNAGLPLIKYGCEGDTTCKTTQGDRTCGQQEFADYLVRRFREKGTIHRYYELTGVLMEAAKDEAEGRVCTCQ
jgi:hypothetical protein